MARAPKPLFLARSTYRRRRLADAARALPVFSALLLVLPLLWPPGARTLAHDLGYLLVLWLAMIFASALLSRGLIPGDGAPDPKPPVAKGPPTAAEPPPARTEAG